jgi:hypothetical protein
VRPSDSNSQRPNGASPVGVSHARQRFFEVEGRDRGRRRLPAVAITEQDQEVRPRGDTPRSVDLGQADG